VSTVALLARHARLQGLMVGSRRQQQDYVAALEQSGIRPVLDSSFSLDQLADAFRYQASGVHFGKVAVEW
jgi:NADPH:quinone reductase-like Zn-dependent oxidoreductase